VDDWELVEAGSGSYSHVVVFAEDVRVDREDLVEGAVEFLATLPGVASADQVDRGIVELVADGVPVARLAGALRRWWTKAEKQRKPWMAAMERRVATAIALMPGFRREGWELTRVLDPEVTHVLGLDHVFGRSPDEHRIHVTAQVRLTVPGGEVRTVVTESMDLADADGFAELLNGRVGPELAALPSVDAMVARWERDGARPGEEFGYARALVARGRLDEARELYQRVYERDAPRHRTYTLWVAERAGVPPLDTAADPRVSRPDEATMLAWQREVPARVDRLRELSGLRLDGSPESLDDLWAWLRTAGERLRAETEPVFAERFYNPLSGGDLRRSWGPFEPWYRTTVELVTAYLGTVVIGAQPGTVWGISEDGGLALKGRSGTGLLHRVYMITCEAVEDRDDDEFDPRRLWRLHGDMIRWTTAGDGRAEIIEIPAR
jgi:hypothetical protein